MTHQKLSDWIATTRPKTLPVAVASVMTGSALAYWSGWFDWKVALLCLLTTVFLQILSNIANDYGDHHQGADTQERLGPLRGIQKGSISATELKQAMYGLVAICLLSGGTLIALAYRSLSDVVMFVVFGALAVIAAITYTVGHKPYGYRGLGDVSVWLFFGLLGVGGSYYLQAHQLSWLVMLPAASTGLLASAVLNINNLRDIEQDKAVGKYTLAVRLGATKARLYHCVLVAAAMMGYAIFIELVYQSAWQCLVGLCYPMLVRHAYGVYRSQAPTELRPMLAHMAMLALLANGLFSLGMYLGGTAN